MEKHMHVLNKHVDRVFNLPNVVGVGVGYKMRGGELSSKRVIVALVAKKLSKEYLPKTSMVPAEIDGVITDVREVGEIRLLANSGKHVQHNQAIVLAIIKLQQALLELLFMMPIPRNH